MDNTNYELYHYGVLGMKWGVRKNPQKAYEKASKKLKKLEEKRGKAEIKQDKAAEKFNDKQFSRFATTRSREKALAKFNKATFEFEKALHRGTKWYDAMEKTFANTSIKFDSDVTNIGENYKRIRNARREA